MTTLRILASPVYCKVSREWFSFSGQLKTFILIYINIFSLSCVS
jgi:hypothetical protein